MSVHLNQKLDAPLFTAVLKTPCGEIVAEGQAKVNVPEEFIEFKSDFVPLYPLNEPMEIVRMYGRREVHRFRGQVYLSSKRLIRLTHVKDTPLPMALDVCCVNVQFPAQVTTAPIPQSAQTSKSSSLFKSRPEQIDLNATMTGMTQTQVEFLLDSEDPFPQGHIMHITVGQPNLFHNTKITVNRVFTYGERSSYLCIIENESDAQRNLRNKFLEQHRACAKHFFEE